MPGPGACRSSTSCRVGCQRHSKASRQRRSGEGRTLVTLTALEARTKALLTAEAIDQTTADAVEHCVQELPWLWWEFSNPRRRQDREGAPEYARAAL
jgi:hypothetical protein